MMKKAGKGLLTMMVGNDDFFCFDRTIVVLLGCLEFGVFPSGLGQGKVCKNRIIQFL